MVGTNGDLLWHRGKPPVDNPTVGRDTIMDEREKREYHFSEPEVEPMVLSEAAGSALNAVSLPLYGDTFAPSPSISFFAGGEKVGDFYWNGKAFVFEGNCEESAKKFIDFFIASAMGWLEKQIVAHGGTT